MNKEFIVPDCSKPAKGVYIVQDPSELFDLARLQQLLDGFYNVAGISAAVIDNSGQILVSSLRPSLCSKHDNSADAANRCRLSRLTMLNATEELRQSSGMICPHGLVDAVEPITLEGATFGGLLMGQVFLKNPDLDFFREEARRYGFELDEYIDDILSVPVVTLEQFVNARQLMLGLTSMLAEQGMARLKAERNEQSVHKHSERFIREIRRQKTQLKMYSMGDASCNELLDSMLENAISLTDSSTGCLYGYDEETTLFTVYAMSQPAMRQPTDIAEQFICKLDKSGLRGEAVKGRKPVVSNCSPDADIKDADSGDIEHLRQICLPVFSKDKIVAVAVVGKNTSDYSQEDIHQLELFMSGSWSLLERRKAEDELKVAKELAESASRLKSQLLDNLSHELRTPLNGIIGGSQLLRFTSLTEEQDEFLTMVEDSSENELLLVNNLLELVRFESEGIHIDNSPFSLKQCIEESVLVHDRNARVKGISIIQELPPDMPEELLGDRARLCQILYNLLGNAVKFTRNGSVTVKFRYEQLDAEQILARFSVIDTGIGIETGKLNKLFEPFIQGDMSNTRDFGGLGLGLPICRRLSTALGGRVYAESVPGEGSSFHLELPFTVSDRSISSDMAKSGLLVLLVEDENVSALAAEGLLRQMGHRVVTACNGEEALAKLERNAFDLALMDIHMPVMDGFEALKKIRQRERELSKTRLPVVAQTAFASWNSHEQFISSEFDGFIAKPLIRKDIERALAKCCK